MPQNWAGLLGAREAQTLSGTGQRIRQGARKLQGSMKVWDMLQGSVLTCPVLQKSLLESMPKPPNLALCRI